MSSDVSRTISCDIHVGRDDSTAIAAHDLHRDTGASFQTSSYVSAVPRHTEWYLRVDANRREHSSSVLHAGFASTAQHSKSQQGHKLESQQEYSSLSYPVCVPACSYGKKAGSHIWWNGHQLRLVRRVAHVFDYGRQEQCEAIDGAESCHADEHVDVNLPVTYRLPYVFDVEVVR